MKLQCPACYAHFSLDAAVGAAASGAAIIAALAMPAALSGQLVQYLSMFRAAGRSLSHDRVGKLLAELRPMLDAETVERNGNRRPAPIPLWQSALEQMIELRAADRLQLPLKSHGYLLEIVYSAADRADAKAERETEAKKQLGVHRSSAERRVQVMEKLCRIQGDLSLGLIDADEANRRRAAVTKESPE